MVRSPAEIEIHRRSGWISGVKWGAAELALCGERVRRRLDGRPRRLRGHLQGERRRLLGVAAGRPPQA